MERLPHHGALNRFCSAKAASHKSYVLCDTIYTKCPRQAHSQKHRADPERERLLTHKGAPCRLTEMSWGASLAAQIVKSQHAMQETPLGQEDPLEKGMATHSSILAWRLPGTEEPGRLQALGFAKTQTGLSTHPQ